MLRPSIHEKLLLADGSVRVVKNLVPDALDPSYFLILLVPESDVDNWLADPIEVYEHEWSEWCLKNGVATLLPVQTEDRCGISGD